jgi:hypothetical protein
VADAPPNPPEERIRVSFLVLIPIGFFAVLGLSFVLLVQNVGTLDSANGLQVSVTYNAKCQASEVNTILLARAAAMGLPAEVQSLESNHIQHRLTLPEQEPDADRIPRVLARTGTLRIADATGQLLLDNTALNSTGVEINLGGMPTTMLRFNAHGIKAISDTIRGGATPITVNIDDVPVSTFTDLPDLDEGYLEIDSGEGITRERMIRAADRSIILGDGPLPCPVNVVDVVPLGAPG